MRLLSHSSCTTSDNDEMISLYCYENIFDYIGREFRLGTMDALKHHELGLPEGSPFQYSNLGYKIAGATLEKVSSMASDRLMYAQFLEPAGLDTARFGPQAFYG